MNPVFRTRQMRPKSQNKTLSLTQRPFTISSDPAHATKAPAALATLHEHSEAINEAPAHMLALSRTNQDYNCGI